ncbi:MAG TPA: GNAT family N-acetyltransferase [Deltaproteobacteria bacterium]|nr:GNAT family N-acetyltransferase [Deltaproteobacteria bacterium]
MNFRYQVLPSDCEDVRRIVDSTGFFYPDEVDMAVELVQAHLEQGPDSGYHFVFAQDAGGVHGYTCYGPVACTRGSFDLYWIAVDKNRQQQGLGRELLEHTEICIQASGGMRVYIETSARELYRPTQRFYERCGYEAEARLKDFYAPGDSKIIYVKHF